MVGGTGRDAPGESRGVARGPASPAPARAGGRAGGAGGAGRGGAGGATPGGAVRGARGGSSPLAAKPLPLPGLADAAAPRAPAAYTALRAAQACVVFPLTMLLSIALASGVFCVLLLSAPVQAVAPRVGYHVTSRALAWFYWWIVWVLTGLNGVRLVMSGDKVRQGDKGCLVICNHLSDMDWLPLLAIACEAREARFVRFAMKDALKWIPLFGWGFWVARFPLFKRSWEKDKVRIQADAAFHREKRLPLWLVSFLEGTRLTAAKLEASQAFAKKRDLPRLEHVMVPRTKGFVCQAKNMRPTFLDCIYDVTLAYGPGLYAPSPSATLHAPPSAAAKHGKPTLMALMSGTLRDSHAEIHVHVRRVAAPDIPSAGMALEAFCVMAFVEKDRLLDSYAHQGRFPATTWIGSNLGNERLRDGASTASSFPSSSDEEGEEGVEGDDEDTAADVGDVGLREAKGSRAG